MKQTMTAGAEKLAQLRQDTDTAGGPSGLVGKLTHLMSELDFECVLSRGGWHRLGGVVDAQYQRVSDNITHWAEDESAGDVDGLIARFVDKGWFATRLAGKTHYFTAPCGDEADDFVQLEIEEIQEVLDRPLVERDWFPDSLEEFLDPLDYPRLEPEPVAQARYQFRRITPIGKLMSEASRDNQESANLRRFFQDWRESSAFDGAPFCRHWVLALREYMDRDGECRMKARPVSTFLEDLPELPPGDRLKGVELANAVHHYDRRLGYPFAWYFIMLSRKAANYTLAQAVLRDLQGAYDYLPAKDLKVLREWETKPYGV